MKGTFSCNIKKLIVGLIILNSFGSEGFSFQKNLSGNLNQPSAHVVTIGSDRVTVNDVTGFITGDTILLIQMQGVGIRTVSPYGNPQSKFGEPGAYEFLIIQSINVPAKEIIFLNNILSAYDTKGSIQVIKVPYYNSATVTSTLTCNSWDPATKTGGVLAIIVGRTLKLNSDIDLSGKGFIGAKDTLGTGICTNLLPANLQEYYPYSYMNAGFKGEGAAIHDDAGTLLFPYAAKGLGSNWTGGGGGNGRYSGGGGGANIGTGGVGGFEDCGSPFNGGNGGFSSINAFLPDRIYLGGGGGASTSVSGLSPAGGNGGGIVIIVADTIIGNGGRILANGGHGGNAVVNGGSGGGGAGGSIAVSVNSYGSADMGISVIGGGGGDNPGGFGEGGGGGGGLVWLSKDVTPNVNVYFSGGTPGNLIEGSTAFPGLPGEKKIGFRAKLNGFLYNSVRSSVTGDLVDSICSNMLPRKISGTSPVGGTIPYTYFWEKSYDQVIWTPLVNDADPVNYTPTVVETATVYFRRTVTDSSVPALIDVSKPVKIIVQPFIKNNIVGSSDTICFAQDPPAFTSKATLQDGNGKYAFIWEVSTDSSQFVLPGNTYDTEGYTPHPALKITSWYRRIVTSGRCIDSSAIVKITVLDTIKNNIIISSAEQICHGMLFTNLIATVHPPLIGGDNTYRYKWESSSNGITGWAPAAGINTNAGYNPDESSLAFPGQDYLRRTVYSGNNDVCVNNSAPVLLTDWPVIANNNISADQTICSGSTPAILSGNLPVNGNSTYTYLWQQKTKVLSWGPAAGPNPDNQKNYTPPALTDSTWFRRVVNSSACSDTSNIIAVNVHKLIANNNVLLLSGVKWDTTICSDATPRVLKGTVPTGGTSIPGDYAFQWESSANKTSGYAAISGATGKDYQPPALANASASPLYFYYRRSVSSGLCSSMSDSIITIKVLPKITGNNITADKPSVCYNTAPHLTGPGLTGGDGGTPTWLWQQSPDGSTWSTAAGISNQQNYDPPGLTLPLQYHRIIFSGPANCCTNTSLPVAIGINPLPIGTVTAATDTTCEGTTKPLNILITASTASPWAVVFNENSSPNNLNATTANTTIQVNPTVVSGNSASFNYTLVSIKDNNGCNATLLTGLRKLIVYKVPDTDAGPDASICGPVYVLTALPSFGIGTWYKVAGPGAATFSNINSATGTVTVDSTGTAWSNENIYTFNWKEINWKCKDSASVIIKFYKRTGLADAGPDKDLYSFDNVDTLRGVKPLTGSGFWSMIIGGGTFSNDSIVNNLSPGENIFEWTVTNGACISKDQVIIKVHELKIPEGFSPNNDGINDEFVIEGLDPAYSEVSLKIVNSAGTEVFFASNMNGETWTNWKGGSDNGILPEGTYYYLLTIKSKRTNGIFKKGGFIILKRYKAL